MPSIPAGVRGKRAMLSKAVVQVGGVARLTRVGEH